MRRSGVLGLGGGFRRGRRGLSQSFFVKKQMRTADPSTSLRSAEDDTSYTYPEWHFKFGQDDLLVRKAGLDGSFFIE